VPQPNKTEVGVFLFEVKKEFVGSSDILVTVGTRGFMCLASSITGGYNLYYYYEGNYGKINRQLDWCMDHVKSIRDINKNPVYINREEWNDWYLRKNRKYES
jgi:hypothetical protein